MSETNLTNALRYNRYPYEEEGYVIHMLTSAERTFFTNAYLIETKNAIVVVDTMMVNSDAALLREQINELNKPLIAVIITHGHPDHYNGTEMVSRGFHDVPVISTQGVKNCIKDTVDSKELKWKPYFAEDWPECKVLPNQIVNDRDVVNLDGLNYSFRDLGAAESSSDLFFTLGEQQSVVFLGDVVFNKVHGFMNNGNTQQWLSVLERLSVQLANVGQLFTGHGLPGATISLIEEQIDYITFYRSSLITALNSNRLLNDENKALFEKGLVDRYPDYRLVPFITAGIEGVCKELTAQM